MNLRLEEFIGKHIDELSQYGKVKLNGENSCSLKFKSESKLYNTMHSDLVVSLEENKKIKLLYTVFPEILDKSFFDEMIKCYGNPNNILALDKLTDRKKSEISSEKGKSNQRLIKRSFSMKEVGFEDNPTLIVWSKEFYEINMSFYYKENGTQLMFKKTNE